MDCYLISPCHHRNNDNDWLSMGLILWKILKMSMSKFNLKITFLKAGSYLAGTYDITNCGHRNGLCPTSQGVLRLGALRDLEVTGGARSMVEYANSGTSGPNGWNDQSIRHESVDWGFESLLSLDMFSVTVSKTSTLSQGHPFVSRNEFCYPCTVGVSNFKFSNKNIHTTKASVPKYEIGNF